MSKPEVDKIVAKPAARGGVRNLRDFKLQQKQQAVPAAGGGDDDVTAVLTGVKSPPAADQAAAE